MMKKGLEAKACVSIRFENGKGLRTSEPKVQAGKEKE